MVDLIINTSAKVPASTSMRALRKRYIAAAMSRALDEADNAPKTEIRPLVAELRRKLAAYENEGGLIA